jgi:hypothetical protein
MADLPGQNVLPDDHQCSLKLQQSHAAGEPLPAIDDITIPKTPDWPQENTGAMDAQLEWSSQVFNNLLKSFALRGRASSAKG